MYQSPENKHYYIILPWWKEKRKEILNYLNRFWSNDVWVCLKTYGAPCIYVIVVNNQLIINNCECPCECCKRSINYQQCQQIWLTKHRKWFFWTLRVFNKCQISINHYWLRSQKVTSFWDHIIIIFFYLSSSTNSIIIISFFSV